MACFDRLALYIGKSWHVSCANCKGLFGPKQDFVNHAENRMRNKSMINDWMKKNVISAHQDTSVKEAARMMLEKKVGTLPVTDEDGVLVGVTTLQDIIQIFLPDFVSLLSNIDFIKDFGVTRDPSTESLTEAEELTGMGKY